MQFDFVFAASYNVPVLKFQKILFVGRDGNVCELCLVRTVYMSWPCTERLTEHTSKLTDGRPVTSVYRLIFKNPTVDAVIKDVIRGVSGARFLVGHIPLRKACIASECAGHHTCRLYGLHHLLPRQFKKVLHF